jgi:thioesterase domain-containing protein
VAGKPFSLSSNELEPLSQPARLDLLFQRASAAGVLPPGMGRQELGNVFSVVRAHVRALLQYLPPRDYPGPISLFRPVQGPPALPSDPSGGWAALALTPLQLLSVPGDHHSLLTEPHVTTLATLLRPLLVPKRT